MSVAEKNELPAAAHEESDLLMKPDQAKSRSSSGQNGRPNGRRSMQVGDWANAAVNIVLGVFLGVVIDGLLQLATTAFWPVAVIAPLLFAGVILLERVTDKLIDPIFPSGVRPARKPRAKGRKPLLRLLSLPVGLIVGMALARLGLGDAILGMLS